METIHLGGQQVTGIQSCQWQSCCKSIDQLISFLVAHLSKTVKTILFCRMSKIYTIYWAWSDSNNFMALSDSQTIFLCKKFRFYMFPCHKKRAYKHVTSGNVLFLHISILSHPFICVVRLRRSTTQQLQPHFGELITPWSRSPGDWEWEKRSSEAKTVDMYPSSSSCLLLNQRSSYLIYKMATRSLVPNIKGTGRSYDLYSLKVEAFSVGLEPPSLWRLIHHLLKNLGEVLLPIRKTPFRGQPPSTVLRYSDRRPWYFIGSVQKEIFVILWVPDQMLLIPLTISGFDFQQITIEQRLKAWQFRLYRENNATHVMRTA